MIYNYLCKKRVFNNIMCKKTNKIRLKKNAKTVTHSFLII